MSVSNVREEILNAIANDGIIDEAEMNKILDAVDDEIDPEESVVLSALRTVVIESGERKKAAWEIPEFDRLGLAKLPHSIMRGPFATKEAEDMIYFADVTSRAGRGDTLDQVAAPGKWGLLGLAGGILLGGAWGAFFGALGGTVIGSNEAPDEYDDGGFIVR